MNFLIRIALPLVLMSCGARSVTPLKTPPPQTTPPWLVQGDIFSRTVKVRPQGVPQSQGTGFFIYVDSREYLVTAGHVLEGFQGRLEIEHNPDEWLPATLNVIGCSTRTEVAGCTTGPIDIAVLALDAAVTMEVPFTLSGACNYSERLFYLGFPGRETRVKTLNSGFPIALVKSAMVSGFAVDDSDKPIGLFLDGVANHGFSGGPVIGEGAPTRILGVVASRDEELVPVLITDDSGKEVQVTNQDHRPLYTKYNKGILETYDIRFALDFIKANPKGPIAQPAPQRPALSRL